MMYFFKSFFYFLFSFFRRIEVGVIFYYPHHFNRGNDRKNNFFNHLYISCFNHNISHLVFEEPDYYSSQKRNNKTIPFDFIYLIIIIMRKFIDSDQKIGEILSRTLLRKFKFNNCCVLSQSMIGVFRGLNQQANIFDLQHGIIYSQKLSYIFNGKIANNIRDNNIKLLLFGDNFKNILEHADGSGYLRENSYVIGVNRTRSEILHSSFNNNILVTLQFTNDHNFQENNKILNTLIGFIETHRNYNFYLRNHPRFNNTLDLDSVYDLDNVYKANDELYDMFRLCSLHLTEYSTTTFEAAYFGIPTFFLESLSNDYNIFFNDFNYIVDNDLEYIISNYIECSNKVKKWESLFYADYNEQKFLSLLK